MPGGVLVLKGHTCLTHWMKIVVGGSFYDFMIRVACGAKWKKMFDKKKNDAFHFFPITLSNIFMSPERVGRGRWGVVSLYLTLFLFFCYSIVRLGSTCPRGRPCLYATSLSLNFMIIWYVWRIVFSSRCLPFPCSYISDGRRQVDDFFNNL